jgi:hypothetical protein
MCSILSLLASAPVLSKALLSWQLMTSPHPPLHSCGCACAGCCHTGLGRMLQQNSKHVGTYVHLRSCLA